MNSVRLNTLEGGLITPESLRPASGAGPSFSDTLSKAIEKVDDLQKHADLESTKIAQGEGNLHETALALEKADVAMRVMLKVRNKLVDAYNEVMRMSI